MPALPPHPLDLLPPQCACLPGSRGRPHSVNRDLPPPKCFFCVAVAVAGVGGLGFHILREMPCLRSPRDEMESLEKEGDQKKTLEVRGLQAVSFPLKTTEKEPVQSTKRTFQKE